MENKANVSSEERERRESVGKVLTRPEMFRIFDNHHVALEPVNFSSHDWRQHTGIIHAYAKNRAGVQSEAAKLPGKKSLTFKYFSSKPVTVALSPSIRVVKS